MWRVSASRSAGSSGKKRLSSAHAGFPHEVTPAVVSAGKRPLGVRTLWVSPPSSPISQGNLPRRDEVSRRQPEASLCAWRMLFGFSTPSGVPVSCHASSSFRLPSSDETLLHPPHPPRHTTPPPPMHLTPRSGAPPPASARGTSRPVSSLLQRKLTQGATLIPLSPRVLKCHTTYHNPERRERCDAGLHPGAIPPSRVRAGGRRTWVVVGRGEPVGLQAAGRFARLPFAANPCRELGSANRHVSRPAGNGPSFWACPPSPCQFILGDNSP